MRLGTESILVLCRGWSGRSNLRELELWGNGMDAAACSAMLRLLAASTTLKTLYRLNGPADPLNAELRAALAVQFEWPNPAQREVALHQDELPSVFWAGFFDKLRAYNPATVEHVDFSGRQMGIEEGHALARALTALTALKSLRLDGCELPILDLNSSTSTLDLSTNALTDFSATAAISTFVASSTCLTE